MAVGRRRPPRWSPNHTDVITYRLDDQMTYVPLPLSWPEALGQARRAFERLAGIDERRITFSINVFSDGKQRSVRISPLAWQRIAANLVQYEIIDIVATPDIIVTDVDAPPRYPSDDVSSHGNRCPEKEDGRRPSYAAQGRSSPPRSPPPPHGTGKLSPKRVLQKLCSTISSDRMSP